LGVAKSLQRPGGNVTGLGTLRSALGAKRVELLKQAFPHVTHIAVLFSGEDLASKLQRKDVESAAVRLGVRVTPTDMDELGLNSAIKRATSTGCQAFVVIESYFINSNRRETADAINASRLPAIFSRTEMVEVGGLMSYAPSTLDNFRRAATYVDKIFKGANPGDLPIEQPSKFELTVNLKTAKAIGITVPTSLLVRADKVIQ